MGSRVREKIVSAAIERFHALGFSACGVQEIVDKAGVPKGSFYNYFKAKELLALEVIEVYTKGSKREMLADTRLAPVERLRQHFEFLATRYKGFGYGKGCLLGNLAAETSDHMPLVRKALNQTLARWTDAVAAVIRAGLIDGSISSERHPEELARFLINSWEGAVVRMKIVGNRQPLDDFFSVVFPILTNQRAIGTAKGNSRKPAVKRAARKR